MYNQQRIPNREILSGDIEVTVFGSFLRRYKLDELPQLMNIIKGEMSIVGPRPGLLSQVDELNADGKDRLKVRPGLTGLAQVNGNIHISWPERWKFDRIYIEKISFLSDSIIILKTLLIIFFGDDKFIKNK